VWEAVATRTWGRTPRKAILHIRPVKVAENQVRFGRMSKGTCWVRAAAYFGFSLVPGVGLLDEIWCLWDAERECLHDKAASTLVVND
jgi:RDD family